MLKKLTPTVLLTVSVIAGAVVLLSALLIAHRQPWLGVTFGASDDGGVKVVAVDPSGPGAAVPVGTAVFSIENKTRESAIFPKEDDLIEEPDTLQGYEAFKEFFRRQDRLHALVVSGAVTLVGADGERHDITPSWPRPVSSLPGVFWVQLIVGGGSFLIGAWVWSLKRHDLSARILAGVGLAMMVSATPAAVYSSRELALEAGLFRVLSALNHLGAVGFGVGMIALFLVYPRRLVPTKWLLVLPAFFGAWWLADTFRVIFAGPGEGQSLPTLIEMIGILLAAGVQYWKTRGDAKARATMRWFGISVALGAGLFVMLVIAPNVMGLPPLMSQGYAFLFFLLVFAGVAVGVARYRLFELEGWAFRILFYLGGVFLLVMIDALLVFALSMDRTPALSLSLLAVVFLYLPLRELLSKRLMSRKGFRESLFRKMLDVALTTPGGDQGARWRGLLQEIFEPLKIDPGTRVESPVIEDDGVVLALPGVGVLPPLRLTYSHRGRKLFSPRDVTLAEELCSMLGHAIESRTAYEKGVAEERSRIARDMHDNIGAQLISALHSPAAERKDTMIRETLSDIRSIINNASASSLSLEETLAELRYETTERLALAGVTLDWRVEEGDAGTTLSAAAVHALRSILREAVSNTLKHAGATAMSVLVAQRDGRVWFTITDNGRGLPETLVAGNGLGNIRARAEALQGSVEIANAQPGLRLHLGIPVSA